MPILFAEYSLDEKRRELRRGDVALPVEPQVFDVLLYLIRNADRVVSKDDLFGSVWDGRIVSESTLTSRINAARRAIGDTGEDQRLIRTVARRGYRFVAPIRHDPENDPAPPVTNASPRQADLVTEKQAGPTPMEVPGREDGSLRRRGSIAVMPILDLSDHCSTRGGLGDAVTHDVITRLAKLRSLFVIAQGTVFALKDRGLSSGEAGRLLGVDYVTGGRLRRNATHVTVSVELVDTRTDQIIWAEDFGGTSNDVFVILDQIGGKIVSAIASEIETAERNRAILRPPNSLDAWTAYHRGLWHMYRFDQDSNEQARALFELAVRLDPTFSRAHAGLSFTHWQSAFQGWGDRARHIEGAYAAAGQGLMADDRDPAVHWAMGRALWLRRSSEHALVELQNAVELSPNYAQGHYAIAFLQSQSGDASAAIAASDHSRQLSPFDPMLFAMYAIRALALARLDRYAEAAEWAERGASRPNAHAHVLALATYCLLLAERGEAARAMRARLDQRSSGYGVSNFVSAFHLAPEAETLFRKVAEGLAEA